MILHRVVHSLAIAALAIAAFLPSPALGTADAEGSRDHPMFTRMPGFYIVDYTAAEFDSHEFSIDDKGDRAERAVEGRKTFIHYLRDEGGPLVSSLQIVRNYRNALKPVGGRVVYESADLLTVVMEKPSREVWLQVNAGSGGEYMLTIVEKAAMAQQVKANDLLAELDRAGHVALNILFDTGKATIRPESAPLVAEVASMLASQPLLRLAVEGHTDNVGAAPANKALSMQRAQAVVAALGARGIAGDRLSAAGFGSERPVADNATDAGRAKNRRVELVKR